MYAIIRTGGKQAKVHEGDVLDVERLRALVAAAGLPVEPPAIAPEDWMSAMGMDKKVQGKRLRFVLLDGIGASRVTADYDERRLGELVGAA